MKTIFYNQGQTLAGMLIVLAMVGLITGGLFYYFQKQIPEIPEVTEKETIEPEGTVSPTEEEKIEEITSQSGEITPISGEPVAQKCADGTFYGQCSVKKPKYCESGQLTDKASKCGCPSGSKISGNHCVIGLPSLNQRSGLIVIKKGVSGENYSKEIASNKGWGFLAVNTSDPNQIKQEISNFYNQKKFDYLLLIGENEEIPYAVYNENWKDESDDGWKTASMLYGDINNDYFIELAIGVLPFSSETELKKYFTDLSPKGNFISFENYTHYAVSGTGWEYYTYGKCLASTQSSIRNYKLTSALNLVSHYQESAVVVLSDAGSADAVYSAGMPANPNQQIPILHKVSFCKDFTGDILQYQKGGGPECEMEYLTNRPIIIHYSCNNAQKLGPQLVENGASAFLGFLRGGGFFYQPQLQLLAGKTIGEGMKNTYNFRMVGRGMKDKEGKLVGNGQDTEGLNTFDITNSIRFSPNITMILFGDPTLKIPGYFQQPNYNIDIEQQTDKIVINVEASKLFPVEAGAAIGTDLLCYTGEAISHSSFIYRNNGLNHVLKLTFPVTKINRVVSQKVIIGGQEIILDLNQETYSINLIKGKTEEYLVVRINASGIGDEKSGRLDYTKNIQIEIEYE